MKTCTRSQKGNYRERAWGMAGYRLATWSVLFICMATCSFSTRLLAEDDMGQKIENTRTIIEKWVETQRIISQEKKDFEIAKEMLNERIELVEREIESLKGKIGEAEENIAEADKKRAEMLDENEKLKEASSSLNDVLATLEGRTKELLASLPEPIKNRVKPLSQRLPEEPEKTELSTSERFQNVVGILNEVDKFNQEISVTSEVRTLEDGSSVEVASLYVGLGQAYYASANGEVAGLGLAAPGEWDWQSANEAAEQISKAISILKNESVASFVQLPVQVK